LEEVDNLELNDLIHGILGENKAVLAQNQAILKYLGGNTDSGVAEESKQPADESRPPIELPAKKQKKKKEGLPPLSNSLKRNST
jgi:hypothetical protein